MSILGFAVIFFLGNLTGAHLAWRGLATGVPRKTILLVAIGSLVGALCLAVTNIVVRELIVGLVGGMGIGALVEMTRWGKMVRKGGTNA
jgi:hypothetical protein